MCRRAEEQQEQALWSSPHTAWQCPHQPKHQSPSLIAPGETESLSIARAFPPKVSLPLLLSP